MEFTREAWENAPEGARLERQYAYGEIGEQWEDVHLVGYTRSNHPVVEAANGTIFVENALRIILPKRKVMVQLWRRIDGKLFTSTPETLSHAPFDWTLLGEHIFEIEGE